MGKKRHITVTVNDKMQRKYRYVRSAPAGRSFDPEFRPQLTPKQMLALGVFCGKYMTDCRKEFPASWFARARLSLSGRLRPQLFWRRCEPIPFGLAEERVDPPGGSARLVSVVLPVLYGAPHAGRGFPADQTLEGNPAPCCANQTALRSGRSDVPAAAAASIAALGL